MSMAADSKFQSIMYRSKECINNEHPRLRCMGIKGKFKLGNRLGTGCVAALTKQAVDQFDRLRLKLCYTGNNKD